MDPRRLRAGEWITGVVGIALLVITFLPWYGRDGSEANAWESFAVTDVMVALAAAMGIALLLVTAMQRTAAVPQVLAGLVLLFSGLAALFVLYRLIDLPGPEGVTRELGVWLGMLGTIALLAGTWRALLDERFPEAMKPNVEVEVLPAPPPDAQPRASS